MKGCHRYGEQPAQRDLLEEDKEAARETLHRFTLGYRMDLASPAQRDLLEEDKEAARETLHRFTLGYRMDLASLRRACKPPRTKICAR